jgi:hypothetical protein
VGSGPSELTAGQHAAFEDYTTSEDYMVPAGAVSCRVTGSDSGNA